MSGHEHHDDHHDDHHDVFIADIIAKTSGLIVSEKLEDDKLNFKKASEPHDILCCLCSISK